MSQLAWHTAEAELIKHTQFSAQQSNAVNINTIYVHKYNHTLITKHSTTDAGLLLSLRARASDSLATYGAIYM